MTGVPSVANGHILTLAEVEREHTANVLNRTGGRVAIAAKLLGISRQTLYRRLNADAQAPPTDSQGEPLPPLPASSGRRPATAQERKLLSAYRRLRAAALDQPNPSPALRDALAAVERLS